MKLKNRDFISLMDFGGAELEGLIELAIKIKAREDNKSYLKDKFIGLLFSVASTRTRISFQVAARQLGGHAEHLNTADLQISNQESLMDLRDGKGKSEYHRAVFGGAGDQRARRQRSSMSGHGRSFNAQREVGRGLQKEKDRHGMGLFQEAQVARRAAFDDDGGGASGNERQIRLSEGLRIGRRVCGICAT
jgi:hypothetical protein